MPNSDPLTPEQRRDVRTALIFFGLVGVFLLALLIATTRWRPESWAALGAIGAGVQALGVLGALIYAGGQLKEARQLRLDQVRPFVVIDIEAKHRLYYITATNLGSVMARDVTFTFDPPLRSSTVDDLIPKVRFLHEHLPTLAPGKTYSTFFDSAVQRYSADLDDAYTVSVRYCDGSGRTFDDSIVLDIGSHYGAMATSEARLKDIKASLDTIASSLAKFSAGSFGGVKIMTPADIAAETDEVYAEMERRRQERRHAEQPDA